MFLAIPFSVDFYGDVFIPEKFDYLDLIVHLFFMYHWWGFWVRGVVGFG